MQLFSVLFCRRPAVKKTRLEPKLRPASSAGLAGDGTTNNMRSLLKHA